MIGGKVVRFSRWRVLVVTITAITPLLALSVSVVANEAPVIRNAVVTPSGLSHLGGITMVTAEVSDDSNALNDVFAEIYGPYFFSVAMTRGAGTDEWFANIELPPNFTPDPVNWDIYVRALDLDLAETADLAGSVQVDGEPQFDEAPTVFDPAVTPENLPSTGGPVQLAVSAWDLRGISEAYAVVTGPDGTATHVVLDPVSADRFEGIFDAPANPGTSAVQYSVVMVAADDIGQQGMVDGGLITVDASTARISRLQVAPNHLSFGKVKIGNRASRKIVLHNHGKKSTGPVSGLLVSPGAPFFLVDEGANGIPFTLRPGESRTYTVEFRPTTVSQPTAAIVVQRTDNNQPGLGVSLSGRGVARK